MTLRLLLVRHGLSSFNTEGRIQGRNDLSTLTNEGVLQALKAGEALKDVEIDSVYSSPLKRAVSTTEQILKNRDKELIPCFDEDLLEVDLSPWTGLTIEEVKEKFPVEYQIWKEKPKELILKRPNGKEYKPIKELANQADKFIHKLLSKHKSEKDKNLLIVGHNAILRCLILKLIGEPILGFRRIRLDNTSISSINLMPKINNNGYNVQIESLNNTTHLNSTIPNKSKNSRVILVRHGETNWNLEGRFQGQIDIPLNATGKEQAEATGKFLKAISIDKAFASSMSRPMETAQIILSKHNQIDIKQEEDLIEIGHGLWEGKLESEIKKEWNDLLFTWQNSPAEVQMPEGETLQNVWDRSVKCWERICNKLEPNETALVVAHDAVNKTILCHLLGLFPENIWMVKQGNGGITVIDINLEEDLPNVITCMNITSHLGGVLDQTAHGAL